MVNLATYRGQQTAMKQLLTINYDSEAKKWVSHIDPGTGVAYRYNSETQETKWEDTPLRKERRM